MRRVQFIAVVLTLIITTPKTFLEILLSATITENIVNITRSLNNIPHQLHQLQLNLLFESQNIGLIAGTVLLFAILPISLRTNQCNEKTSL